VYRPNKWWIVLVGLLVLSLALGGCKAAVDPTPQATTPKKGGTLIVAHGGDPMSFNPCAKTDDFAYAINQNLFNKLVTLDIDYAVVPDLAKELPTVSGDGKQVTFKLHENVKWHDGTALTSADVKWTLEAILEHNGSARANLVAIDKVEAPDAHTVVLHLKQPDAALLGFLAWYGTFIMPKHLYEGTDWLENPVNLDPVGTGPFKFVRFLRDDHVELAANPNYFKGAPYLDKVFFKIIPDANTALQAFLNKEVDLLGTRPPLTELDKLKATAGVEVQIRPTPSRYYISFNMGKGHFADLKVRQAVQYAVDSQKVVDLALKGIGGVSEYYYTPAIEWAVNTDVKAPAFDIAKAKALLDEAGKTAGTDGLRFKTTLPYFSGQEWKDIGTVIKDCLKEVGIEVVLQELEIGAWIEKCVVNQDFEITILNGFQGPDPSNLRTRFGTNGNLNVNQYSNEVVDEHLALGASKSTPAERAEHYKKVQEILHQELPMHPVGEVAAVNTFRTYLKGLPWTEALGKVTFSDFSLTWRTDTK